MPFKILSSVRVLSEFCHNRSETTYYAEVPPLAVIIAQLFHLLLREGCPSLSYEQMIFRFKS